MRIQRLLSRKAYKLLNVGNIMTLLNFDSKIIKGLFKTAAVSERKRALQILRSSDKGEIPAIMFEAFLPGTYVKPHKHPLDDAKEIWILLQGRVKVIIFNELGEILEIHYLSNQELTFIEIPSKTYHTLIALEPSAICELYMAKYNPTTYKEFAPWAPEENDPGAKIFLEALDQKTK